MMSVYDRLLELGVDPSLQGFEALEYAVELVCADPSLLHGSITKVIYPEVARRMNTTASRVERVIRHAVARAFDSMPGEVATHYFGNCIRLNSGAVPNRTFIAAIVNAVRRG